MTTSFSQLIDVYVTLSQQDGIDNPEPFFITLTKRFRWSSRLSALYLAADDSKGLSAVQAEQYSEDYAEEEEEDDHKYTDLKDDRSAPAHSSTEARNEVIEEETIGGQETVAITTTDKGPAHGEISAIDNDPVVPGEVLKEGEDNESEHGEIDTILRAEVDQPEFVEQDNIETEPKQDNIETEPTAAIAALAEDDSSDQIGGVENGDDESSGSSTVRGENDLPPSSQYSSSEDFDDDDGNWLMDEEDTVPERSPEHPLLAPVLDKPILPKSASDAVPEDQAAALADEEEWPEMNEPPQYDEWYPLDNYDQEDHSDIPNVAAQDWDQIGHEDVHQYEDVDDEVPELDVTNGQVVENEWTGFDEELDFDVGAQEQHVAEAVVLAPEVPVSSGTFRVPDDSAGEEDEDSITYDDDELDLSPQPKPDTIQGRSSSQSPLGKRSRDDDESDQESKRLKSR